MLLQVILVLLLTLFGAESKKDTVPEREVRYYHNKLLNL